MKNAPLVFSIKIDRVINFSSFSRDHHKRCVTDFNIVDISRTAGPWREIFGRPVTATISVLSATMTKCGAAVGETPSNTNVGEEIASLVPS